MNISNNNNLNKNSVEKLQDNQIKTKLVKKYNILSNYVHSKTNVLKRKQSISNKYLFKKNSITNNNCIENTTNKSYIEDKHHNFSSQRLIKVCNASNNNKIHKINNIVKDKFKSYNFNKFEHIIPNKNHINNSNSTNKVYCNNIHGDINNKNISLNSLILKSCNDKFNKSLSLIKNRHNKNTNSGLKCNNVSETRNSNNKTQTNVNNSKTYTSCILKPNVVNPNISKNDNIIKSKIRSKIVIKKTNIPTNLKTLN